MGGGRTARRQVVSQCGPFIDDGRELSGDGSRELAALSASGSDGTRHVRSVACQRRLCRPINGDLPTLCCISLGPENLMDG